MLLKCVVFFSVMLGVLAQKEPTVEDALKSLPTEVQGNVDTEQLNELKNKSIVLFREKCGTNGGPDAFTNAEKAKEDFTKCIQGLVNTTQLQQEMQEAEPNGTLDEVFKRYCAKTPQFKGCFKTMAEATKPCLASDEKINLKTVYNITEQLADFICYKEGDRITLFIAEGGPECFQSKQEAIQNCVNSTFGAEFQFNANNLTANAIPKIAFTQKECGQLNSLQACMVTSLESCAAPTTANIVESLFRFIREATPCITYVVNPNIKANSQTSKTSKPNSAGSISMTFATVLMASAAALLA